MLQPSGSKRAADADVDDDAAASVVDAAAEPGATPLSKRLMTRSAAIRVLADYVPLRAYKTLTRCPSEFGSRDATKLLALNWLLREPLLQIGDRPQESMLAYCHHLLKDAVPPPELPLELWALILSHLTDMADRRALGRTCRQLCALHRDSIRSLVCIRDHAAVALSPYDMRAPLPRPEWLMTPRMCRFRAVTSHPASLTNVCRTLRAFMGLADREYRQRECTLRMTPSMMGGLQESQSMAALALSEAAVLEVPNMNAVRHLVAAANTHIPAGQHRAALAITPTRLPVRRGMLAMLAEEAEAADREPGARDTPTADECYAHMRRGGWLSTVRYEYLSPMHQSVTVYECRKWRVQRPDHAYPQITLYLQPQVYALHRAALAADQFPPRLQWWNVLNVVPDPRPNLTPPAPAIKENSV